LAGLVGDGERSLASSSDGSGSLIENEPLLLTLWVVVSDSESVLLSSDVLGEEEGAVVLHLRLNLELDSVIEWLVWISPSDLVNGPSLVGTIVAIPEDSMSVVLVSSSVDVEALVSVVADVSDRSIEPSDSLVDLALEWSHDGGDVDLVALAGLVGQGKGSLGERSDGLGTRVEHEPLLVVIWVVVSDSESELLSTNVLGEVQGSLASHSGLDLELESISERVVWEVSGLGVDDPSLVQSVVAVVPDGVGFVHVSSSGDVEALVAVVSDVSDLAWVEGDLLVGVVLVDSHDGWVAIGEATSLSA